MSEFFTKRSFHDIFGNRKVILGMIHMSGMNDVDRLERTMKELDIYVESGVTGVIFENYHCGYSSLISTLERLPLDKWRAKLIYGINVLPNEYEDALALATQYKMDFIQLDYVSGKYSGGGSVIQLNIPKYNEARKKYPYPIVLGGVHPKYYHPAPGSHLFEDLQNAKDLCEAIVVTGTATGSETPLSKILQFRNMIGQEFPLIVGAGVTGQNIRGQLEVANGCIIGSSFKPYGQTNQMIMKELVTPIMNIVNEFNNYELHKEEELEKHILPSSTEPKEKDSVEPVLDRLSSAQNAARKANFPDYLIPVLMSLLQDNESFQFPWTCDDCQYFNDQVIANCKMCRNDNPNYDSEKASRLLTSQPNHLRFE
jgi:predicted TIM-barrel enzyme